MKKRYGIVLTRGMDSKELATGMEGDVLFYRSSTGKVNVSVI